MPPGGTNSGILKGQKEGLNKWRQRALIHRDESPIHPALGSAEGQESGGALACAQYEALPFLPQPHLPSAGAMAA